MSRGRPTEPTQTSSGLAVVMSNHHLNTPGPGPPADPISSTSSITTLSRLPTSPVVPTWLRGAAQEKQPLPIDGSGTPSAADKPPAATSMLINLSYLKRP